MIRMGPHDERPPLLPVGPAERRPRLVHAEEGTAKWNGNDVNLDRQMARLAENSLFHNALTQILTGALSAADGAARMEEEIDSVLSDL
jgi:flagellar basal body rod protein FlgB